MHLHPSPQLPGDGLELLDRGVSFELPRSRETDMADAIICDTLGEMGEVEVRLVEGVRQHTVKVSTLRGYVVCIAPDGDDPTRIRLVVMRFSPLGVAIERAGLVFAGLVVVAVLGYLAIVAVDRPSLSATALIKAPLLALALYLAVLAFASLTRHLVDRSMGPPSGDETLLRIADELRATLTRSRPRRAPMQPIRDP
jgi:hypothetical protein